MKLLQKTSRSYFSFSVLLLLIAIPVFYFVIRVIVTEESDESLLSNKKALMPGILKAISDTTQDVNFLDHDITLIKTVPGWDVDSLATISFYDSLSDETVPYRVLRSRFNVEGEAYLLMIRSSMVDNDNLIKSIVFVQVLLLLFLLGGLYIMNRRLAKKIWLPFKVTLETLKDYNVEEDDQLKLEVSGIDEFNELNTSLVELTGRVHLAYTTQKQFTENASHEIQTPLAILQSKLELLMQTNPLSEEQANLISGIADANHRMTQLNKTLILLTRIDHDIFLRDTEQVSVTAVVLELVQQFQPYIDEKQIKLDLTLTTDVEVNANKALFEILIGNVFANAIRHNYSGGFIHVTIENQEITINNTGKAQALDQKNIFKRFYKTSTDNRSLGLGLEIVKKLCVHYSFTITYTYLQNRHRFGIKFAG